MTSGADIVQAGGELLVPTRPLKARGLVDRSGSMRDLVRVMCEAMGAFERNFAAYPAGSVLSRVLFDDQLEEIAGGRFLTAGELPGFPFGNFYSSRGWTHLDRYLNRELQKLLIRFRNDRSATFTHLLITVTDGINENGPERFEAVRQQMSQVKAVAAEVGGITRSRIIAWYVGMGLTLEHHQRAAFERYHFPKEWFAWFPATDEGVRDLGQRVTDSVTQTVHGGDTVIM